MSKTTKSTKKSATMSKAIDIRNFMRDNTKWNERIVLETIANCEKGRALGLNFLDMNSEEFVTKSAPIVGHNDCEADNVYFVQLTSENGKSYIRLLEVWIRSGKKNVDIYIPKTIDAQLLNNPKTSKRYSEFRNAYEHKDGKTSKVAFAVTAKEWEDKSGKHYSKEYYKNALEIVNWIIEKI